MGTVLLFSPFLFFALSFFFLPTIFLFPSFFMTEDTPPSTTTSDTPPSSTSSSPSSLRKSVERDASISSNVDRVKELKSKSRHSINIVDCEILDPERLDTDILSKEGDTLFIFFVLFII